MLSKLSGKPMKNIHGPSMITSLRDRTVYGQGWRKLRVIKSTYIYIYIPQDYLDVFVDNECGIHKKMRKMKLDYIWQGNSNVQKKERGLEWALMKWSCSKE